MGSSRTKRRNQIRRNILKARKHQERPPPTEQEDEEPEPAPAPVTVASIFRNDDLTELCRVWNVNDVSEEPPLVAAVALNKVALVKRLIGEDGIDLESRGPGGRTALLEAVRTRSLELVDLLAAHGADASAVDAEGSTAPLLALTDDWWTQEATLALCGLLPKLDVDRAADVGKGYTLLHHAVRRGWDTLLEALLERRAQVDCATLRGITPLMLAGCTRRWQTAQRLLLAGARLRQEDAHGCTPLCYACATLLVKGRNRETVELMLRRLSVPLDDYVLRRLHLLRHPPCAPADFAAPVSCIVAQALYCVSRHVRNGLRALLDAHVFAHVARTLDAHRACVAYVHALLGLLFDLARHCECCTVVAGVDAATLTDAFVGGGAPDACLAVMVEHCVPGASTTLSDPLMRLLVAALLPLAVVFGRSPDAGAAWIARRGADLAPFYAVFRRATHISVSARTDLVHLRLVRRQLRSFHKLYAGDATTRAQPRRAGCATAAQPEKRGVTSMAGASAERVAKATRDGIDSEKSAVSVTKEYVVPLKTSFKGVAFKDSVIPLKKASKESVVQLTEASVKGVSSKESIVSMTTVASSVSVAARASSSSIVRRAVDSTAQEDEEEYERLQGAWQEVVKRGSKTALRNNRGSKSKSQTCLTTGRQGAAKTGPTASSQRDVVTTRSEPSLEKIGGATDPCRVSPGKTKTPEGRRVSLAGKGASDGQENKPDEYASALVDFGRPADKASTAPDPMIRASPRGAKAGGRRARRTACAPTATSTPKASASARFERARRKDAEAVEAYYRLPRALHFGDDSLESALDNDAVEATPSDSDMGVDSGLGASLEPCDVTPLIVIYDPQASRHHGDDEVETPTEPRPSQRASAERDNYVPSVARPRVRLSEVDLDIRYMLSSLELSMLGLNVSREDFGKRVTSKKSRCERIEVRLSERRRLTVVDDLFTALVDALSTRWRAAQATSGQRVLLSAFRDLAQSQLHRALSPLERERLARHVRRWRAYPRKARACDAHVGTEQSRRVTALLMSHLSALARCPVGSSFKRRASALDTVLRKRVRVGAAPAGARKGRAVRRRVLRTLGAHAPNLKVIEPSRGDEDADATFLGGDIHNHHYPHHHRHQPHQPTKSPVAPPPGFGPQHVAGVRSSGLHSAANAAEFRPQRQDFLYAHDAVNVQALTPALAFGVGVDGCASSDDFASVRGVVDHLRLDDDADFEDFLQRKALADTGAARWGGGAGALTEKKEIPAQQFKKWVPLRQPPRASLVQDVAALRMLRHDNLVVWETVTVSAAGLRIDCARMQCNLAQLVERAGADMTATRVLALCHQMARGLRYLHSQQLVHGGLKPSNVLVDVWGAARLADFGLYRLKPPTASPCLWWSTETRAQFARTCQLVCSPESDAQALGMLFHFAATGGQHPFVGTHAHDKPAALGCASYELRQLTHDLLQHERALRPTLRTALRHVCWWDAHERRTLVLRCAGWMAEGCAEQSVFIDVALEPLLPRWRARAAGVLMLVASDTPSGLLRMLNSAPQLTDALLRRLPELPLALHRLAAQTPSLRTLLHFSSHSTFDTV